MKNNSTQLFPWNRRVKFKIIWQKAEKTKIIKIQFLKTFLPARIYHLLHLKQLLIHLKNQMYKLQPLSINGASNVKKKAEIRKTLKRAVKKLLHNLIFYFAQD